MMKCVLYDLDGTIIDTNELILETFEHVFTHHCGIQVSRATMIPLMGLPLDDQFRQFTGRSEVADLVEAYREYNIRRHDDLVTLFPGVREVVDRLAAAGVVQGVVTTKVRATTERALRMFGLMPYMKAIVAYDDVTRPKPDPEPVQLALAKVGVLPADAVMVGDSPYDMQSGKSAGAMAVAVGWSLKDASVLREAGADVVIDQMQDLYEIVGIT